jgi:uncharacterized Zn finger protein (UPF0148 family)
VIDERLAAEVNRLYWETDVSVGEIANRLGLSRRALYDAIRGRPTGSTCPACGAGLVYTNRSRRDAGQATCPDCGLEVDVAAAGQSATDTSADEPAAEPAAPGQAGELDEAEDRTWAEPDATIEQEWDAGRLAPIAADAAYRLDRALLLGGAALLGVAAGAILMLLVRRR